MTDRHRHATTQFQLVSLLSLLTTIAHDFPKSSVPHSQHFRPAEAERQGEASNVNKAKEQRICTNGWPLTRSESQRSPRGKCEHEETYMSLVETWEFNGLICTLKAI